MVAPQSVALVERLAGSMGTSLIDRWTPDALAGTRLAGAPLAHWIAMTGLALVSLLAARVVTSGGFLLAMRLIPVLRSGRAHYVAKAVLLPLGLFLASLAFTVGSFVIGLSVVARALVAPYIEIVSWLAIGWIVWRAIDATARVSLVRMTRTGRLGAVSVVTMVRRAAKILVVVAASIARHALRLKPDHPMGAGHHLGSMPIADAFDSLPDDRKAVLIEDVETEMAPYEKGGRLVYPDAVRGAQGIR